MDTWPEENVGEYAGGGSITAQVECGGIDPWDFFPAPQFGIKID
jgi:hypothetical protein